jgi:hypothetical protein
MQDLSSGQLFPLTPEQADQESKRQASIARFRDGVAKASPQLPPVADRGPIFHEGEIVEIRGGRFRIRKINHWGLVLDSLELDSLPRSAE